jgi:hypothetical protein
MPPAFGSMKRSTATVGPCALDLLGVLYPFFEYSRG